MMKINKAIAGVLLFAMVLSGVPEGFGAVSKVHAAEPAASAEGAAEPDSFSGYTVEFTYNDLQYVLNGGESVALSEILSKVGLAGEATEVTVSDPELFSASKEDGVWTITAHKAFSSDEWMRVTIGDVTYEIAVTDDPTASGTCGENLTWTFDSTTHTLTIAGTGAMYDFGYYSPVPWAEYLETINSIVIESGVTSIGEIAFRNCSSLTSITIPTTVTNIGMLAFDVCSSLTSITIPTSVTSIRSSTFANCRSLESIEIPSSITSIGDSVFSGCSSLTSITIPTSVTSIGEAAFDGCVSLESIEIPTSVTSIGEGAFCGCHSLTSIAIPSGVTSIESHVFACCTSLESIVIPTSVTSIEDDAFEDCNNLTTVYYNGTHWDDIKGKFPASVVRVSTFDVSDIDDHVYDGSAYNPTPTVQCGTTLTLGTDYTLNYQKKSGTDTWNDVVFFTVQNVGTYRVRVRGKPGTDYADMIAYSNEFSITPRNVTIKAASWEKTYDGTPLTNSEVTVTTGNLATGDTLSAIATGSATNVSDTRDGNNPIAAGYKVMRGNTDVSDNYTITTVAGTLTITPKPVTVTAQDKAFTFDGETHSWPRYDVDGLVGNDAIEATVTGSIFDPSESPVENVVASYQFNAGTPGNYSVTTQNGRLTMSNASYAITITAGSGEKTYDGTALTNNEVTVTSGSLADGDSLVAEATGSATNVSDTAVGNNPVKAGYKVMHGNTDVSDNYTITVVDGTLTINPKAVTITAQDKAFAYDGKAHSWPDYDVDGLIEGDATITATIEGSITAPSESPVANVVSAYEFKSGTPGNYSVTTQNGQLTMTNASYAITITAASGEKTYDGTPLTNSEVTITSGSLAAGDKLVAEAAGSATNVSDTAAGNNPIAPGYKVMHGNTDVTDNYAITTVAGTLTINPKPVTITAQDQAFIYDGETHSWPEYDVTGLVGNDEITATVTGSIKSSIESPVANVVASYKFKSGTPSNYEVTTKNGQLTMTGKPVNRAVITFHSNNGADDSATQRVVCGETVNLKANTFSYAGHTFREWTENADGSGRGYSDGASVAVNADMSLYAQWTESERRSYSVTVTSLFGGLAEADKDAGAEGEVVRLFAKADDGFYFKGWKVEAGGVELSDRANPNATFKIGTADVRISGVFVMIDDDNHGQAPAPENDVKDDLDELRSRLNKAASDARATGLTQTVTWDKGTSLPYDIMKTLHDNPGVTLVFSYKYKDKNYTVTLPGKSVIANPAIPWYGPVYLHKLYGNEKTSAPAATAATGTYTVKSGDTLWGIARHLKTTVKHLQEVNQIKDADKIKPGMVLKY